MKSAIFLFALYAFFAATLYATPVEILSSSKKESDGWYYAGASLDNTTDNSIIKRASSVNAQSTFYTGEDLKGSACYGRNGLPQYNAKDSDFIAAMRMKNFEHCFRCLRVERGSRHVIVKVIDKCGGCPNSENVDLTKSAFKKLGSLDEGRINIRWRPINCPKKGEWPVFEER
ncbi:1623_t:CDS:1 [Acaulospora morrowiae]|uniref:1623_t:CDS:1 n=1 Tax=Acaulospora morrowiae TaxID=94023 RepID=A0A9N9FVF0_9GLOM|nr:1623_t:CDS:1 [Acaulospora morrowiae]